MTVTVAKGTKIKLRFDDKTTLDYEPSGDLELSYVLAQVERFAAIFGPKSAGQEPMDSETDRG